MIAAMPSPRALRRLTRLHKSRPRRRLFATDIYAAAGGHGHGYASDDPAIVEPRAARRERCEVDVLARRAVDGKGEAGRGRRGRGLA